MLAAVTVPRHCPVTARTWRRAPPGQSTDEAPHQARKAARRARYVSEAMAPGIGKKASRFAKQMKRSSRSSAITRTPSSLAGENAFSYGLLHGRDACDAARLQAQGWETWQRASRPRYRRWMH
jgi:CHAD domain